MSTNTAELKNHLHKLIVETDDESILSKVQAYFNTLKGKNIDWWDTISDQEKDAINIGLRQLENGEGIQHEEVRKKADKILGRK
jgi:predicted transcriptional regulator